MTIHFQSILESKGFKQWLHLVQIHKVKWNCKLRVNHKCGVLGCEYKSWHALERGSRKSSHDVPYDEIIVHFRNGFPDSRSALLMGPPHIFPSPKAPAHKRVLFISASNTLSDTTFVFAIVAVSRVAECVGPFFK